MFQIIQYNLYICIYMIYIRIRRCADICVRIDTPKALTILSLGFSKKAVLCRHSVHGVRVLGGGGFLVTKCTKPSDK